MSYPNYEAADEIIRETLRAAGFVYTDRSGEEQIDDQGLKEAVYLRMVDKHVVADQKNMAKVAVTSFELYAAILPAGPGVRRQPATEEESAARDQLQRKLWGFANTGTSGYVNQRVEAEGLTYIMCEALVARTYRTEETGRTKPVTELGRFLTDDEQLIENYSTLPRAAKLVKAAEAVAKHMVMAIRRHPELSAVVARQIRSAVRQSQGALGAAVNGKTTAALGSAQTAEEDVA